MNSERGSPRTSGADQLAIANEMAHRAPQEELAAGVACSGLAATDRVVIDGLVRAVPGGKVAPLDGTIHYDATADGQG